MRNRPDRLAFINTVKSARVIYSGRLALACWVLCAGMVTTLTHAHAGGDCAHAHAGGAGHSGPGVSHRHLFFFGFEIGVAPDQPGDGQSVPSGSPEVVELGMAGGLRASDDAEGTRSLTLEEAPRLVVYEVVGVGVIQSDSPRAADADRPTPLCARAAGNRSGVQLI